MKTRALWIIFLSIYLVLVGLVHAFALTFTGIGLVLGILAIIAGVCLFAGK